MIPLKLQLKNFLSYGSSLQTINFEPYNFICLSGKNGHGKSALLDAITWAVWGDARKISGSAKADDGLLRLGQTNMLVIFDFEFNGHMYRIRREYLQTYGKPIATLEFGLVKTETEFIPLTDKTIRETQKKIERTLNLDFDTFSNSAFLRQGNANEFSKKSSKDRKQILATILGLDKYEVIRKLALEQVKQASTQKTALIAVQEKREREIATKTAIEAAGDILNQKLNALQKNETAWKKEFDTFQQKQVENHEKQKIYTMLVFQKNQFIDKKIDYKKQLQNIFIQWREINKKRKLVTTLTSLQEEKNKLLNDITHHQNLLAKNLEHKELLFKLKQDLYEIEQRYQNDQIKEQQKKQLEYERTLSEERAQLNLKQSLEQQLKNYNSDMQAHSTEVETLIKNQTPTVLSKEEITYQEHHLEKRKAAYQQFAALGNWLTKELQNLAQKKKLAHDDNDPSCPLCEQNLSATRRKFLKVKFVEQEQAISHRLDRLKKIIPRLKEILLSQHDSITKAKGQLQQQELTQNKITDLIQTKGKIEINISSTITDIEAIAKTLASLTATLAKQKELLLQDNTTAEHIQDATYHTLSKKRDDIEKELGSTLYNQVAHKNAQTNLTIIENKLAEFERIKIELERQKERKEHIINLCSALKAINVEEKNIHNKLIQFKHLDQEISDLNKEKDELNNKQKLIREEKDNLLHEKGSIENQQKHLNTVIHEFEQEKHSINTLEKTINEYQAIAYATGKDGIQALLIEDAIPEIEQEANHLLSKLTNNQATIFIESLRDLKKGGSKETLDINISDAAGIRPYELFSGGEAFRIDFALRIAISKLLARRAGTALQTLIIDEGFGSQDEEGLSHIMDALYKIQDDFSKIIVVSHLSSMKDQFPIHFVVEKGPQGSVVNVLEQG